jgi:hypothetical protein
MSPVPVSSPPVFVYRLQMMVHATILNINGGIALFPLQTAKSPSTAQSGRAAKLAGPP